MKNDNPDTLPETERTRWLETHAEDVFLPSVRVLLQWRDVEFAVDQGGVVASEAHAMWANWATPGSPTRLSAEDDIVPADRQPAYPLESSWAIQKMPTAEPRQPSRGGWWFVGGLVAGAALVWIYASMQGISLLG